MKTVYKRTDNTLHSQVGDDVVALNVRKGQCYGMEKVTASLWAILAKPSDLDDICERLFEIYDVDLQICRAEVSDLLEVMRAEGLVESAGRGVNASEN